MSQIVIPDTVEEIDNIIKTLHEMPLTVLGNRGSGKSTSVMSILERWIDKEKIIIKVFDSSLRWYTKGPTKYRLSVTLKNIMRNKIDTIGDVVYDIYDLSLDDRRNFFASIVKCDMDERYALKKEYGEMCLKSLPWIVYIIEESETFLNTHTLKSEKPYGKILTDMVCMSRNYKITYIAVCTYLNRLSVDVKERSNLLIARTSGRNQLNAVKGSTNIGTKKLSQILPKYYFLFWSGKASIPFRIFDTCESEPRNYVMKVPYEVKIRPQQVIQIIKYKKPRRMHWITKMILKLFAIVLIYSVYVYYIY